MTDRLKIASLTSDRTTLTSNESLTLMLTPVTCKCPSAIGTPLVRGGPPSAWNRLMLHALSLVVLTVPLAYNAEAELINFDAQTTGSKPGNIYSSKGVSFTTAEVLDPVAVGDLITLTSLRDGFEILERFQAPSSPNVAAPLSRVAGSDLLMAFEPAVTSVSLELDSNTSEAPDLVRLLALEATGIVDQYSVIGIDESLDNVAVTLNVTRDTLFNFALFQVTTESELFDNLQFHTVPSPGDVDGDGDCDANDIDGIGTAIRTGQNGSRFDVNSDGAVTCGRQATLHPKCRRPTCSSLVTDSFYCLRQSCCARVATEVYEHTRPAR